MAEPTPEPTAAHTLARMVRERMDAMEGPDWTEAEIVPRCWRWVQRDEDNGPEWDRFVEVDGADRRFFPLLPEQVGVHHGPSIIGYCGRIAVRVDLPFVTDMHEMRDALEVLAVLDILPKEGSQS